MNNSAYKTKIGLKPQNELLFQDNIGKSKVSTRDLPHEEFTYGKYSGNDLEGAREVSMSWNFHNSSPDRELPSDFKQINRYSIRSGLHTSKDFRQLRKSTDAYVPYQKGTNVVQKLIPYVDFAYGVPNRPSTPVRLVLSNYFGEEAQDQLRQTYQARHQEYETFKKKKVLPKLNRATELAANSTSQKISTLFNRDDKPLFKLTKFKTVPSKVDSKIRNWTYGEPIVTKNKQHANEVKAKVQ